MINSFEEFAKNYPYFCEDIKNVISTEDDYRSLNDFLHKVKNEWNGAIGIDCVTRYRGDYKKDNFLLFFAWIFKDKLNECYLYQSLQSDKKIKLCEAELYFYYYPSTLFQGLSGVFSSGNGCNGLLALRNKSQWTNSDDLAARILSYAKSKYTVYITPNKRSFYQTIWALAFLIEENPIIQRIRLRELIATPSDDGEAPILDISIANLFIPEDKMVDSLQKEGFLNAETPLWDYKKSKYYLEVILTFLTTYFNKHANIKGSGKRVNQAVYCNDFISFKHCTNIFSVLCKDFFEDDVIYLKAENGENFKIDIVGLN
ncbi:MAG TPA: hypothetical protein VL201_02825 [Patescibacteria group bacterium]|jgi:hypothetical protein|nr:hypothetical protein [Patescibacteria group bacterium]